MEDSQGRGSPVPAAAPRLTPQRRHTPAGAESPTDAAKPFPRRTQSTGGTCALAQALGGKTSSTSSFLHPPRHRGSPLRLCLGLALLQLPQHQPSPNRRGLNRLLN